MSIRGVIRLRVATGSVIALLIAACSKSTPPAPPAAEVVVETIAQRDLPLTLSYPARVSGSRVVEVRARVGGQIIERAYREGSAVKAGDLLFRIDPVSYRNVYDQAAAQVDMQQAVLAEAESDFKRVDALVKEGAVSGREFEQASATMLRARASIAGAEATKRSAKLDLEYTAVRAPVSGVASKEAVTVGNLVNGGNNSTGDLLTSIVQADPAYVEFSAPEPEYLHLRDLASVSVTGLAVHIKAGSSCRTVGKVDFTDTFVNARTGTIRGRAIFENKDGLLTPGFFGRLRLFGGTHDTLLVPDSAIASDQSNKIVFTVAEDGTVGIKRVELGPIVEGLRVIRSGLAASDRIVIEGLQRARPGQKVKAEDGKIEVVAQ